MCKAWNSHGARRFHHGRSDWIWIGCRLNENWSSGSAIEGIWNPVPVFDAPVDIQDRVIAPCWVARLGRDEIPVLLVSTRPCHHVDARSPAEDLAHRQRHRASVQVWVGLSDKLPIALRSQIFVPAMRVGDAWHVVVAAGLKQQDADTGIFGESASYHRPRRA